MPLTVILKNTMAHVHNNNITGPKNKNKTLYYCYNIQKIWQYQSSFVNIKDVLLHKLNVKHSNQAFL